MRPIPGTLVPLLVWTILLVPLPSHGQAQIVGAIDGTNTDVTQVGDTFNITNGTPTGSNLFHSFQQFGLNQGQIANFLSNPAIQNIFARVTGGNASVIDGRIQVTSSDPNLRSNANLYLMNPAGIVFGANASLNVPASFTATTANRIGFGNGWFNAVGDNTYAALMDNPTSYAFTSPQPGVIINAGNLVSEGGITLLGGTIVNTGNLFARRGMVTIAAVPGEKLVRISHVGSPLSLDILPPGTPTTTAALALPQLLTGGGLNNATGVILENGVVRLTGSGVQVETGDIAARNINASGNIFLSAVNNITVETLQGGSIDVTAGRLFRAIGIIDGFKDEGRPVSIRGGGIAPPFSSISIRYAGGTTKILSSSKENIQIFGDGIIPFVVGPDSASSFVPLIISSGTSGTAGSIYIDDRILDPAGNGSTYLSIPDRMFSLNLPLQTLQTSSELAPNGIDGFSQNSLSTEAQTIQRQLNRQLQAFVCYSSSLASNNLVSDPCVQAIQDEQQILKILNEPADPVQSKPSMKMESLADF